MILNGRKVLIILITPIVVCLASVCSDGGSLSLANNIHKSHIIHIGKGSNIMKFSLQFVLLLASFMLISMFNSLCYSQGVLPNGEPIISFAECDNSFGLGMAMASQNNIYFINTFALSPTEIYSTDETISEIEPKEGNPELLIVTFTSGEGIVLDLSYLPARTIFSFYFPSGASSIRDFAIGDAIYILSSSNVYVTRDSGKTVQIDTTGLEGYAFSITIDSAQNVYAATSNGLYKQAPDSSVWHRVTSFTLTNNIFKMFIDRLNRIFLAGFSTGTYISTDNGNTWSTDTSGLGGLAGGAFGDDALGNDYCSAGGKLYKSVGGTQPWTEIDQGLFTLTGTSVAFNSISGDSVLFVGTSFGLYESTDQGQSWSDANNGIKAETFFGFGKLPSGKIYLSTALGIFSKNPSDTAWQKIYPTNGYQSGLPIYQDGLGNLYTNIPDPNNYTAANLNIKSTDGGVTWFADTAGISPIGHGTFYVDETGRQHIATTNRSFNILSMVYNKDAGSNWAVDTNGFPVFDNSYSSAIASNKHGMLFISGAYANGVKKYPQVFKRPIGGGTWVPDTAGIPSTVSNFNWLFPDINGNMFGIIDTQLYHQESGTWVKKSLPSGITLTDKVSVDSSGAIYVTRTQYFNPNGNTDVGISVSTDNGSTWSDLTHDTINVHVLASFGDTTYAFTSNGILVLTPNGVTAVKDAVPIARVFRLEQNYPNPFNPTTQISYTLAKASNVSLKIYDILGREVATLVNGKNQPGQHSVSWNALTVPSGVYFYRIVAGDFVQTKKMVLVK